MGPKGWFLGRKGIDDGPRVLYAAMVMKTSKPSFARAAALALALGGLTLGGLTATSCAPTMIAGTQVEDTEENREILTFLTRYQQAMQARDVEKLISLCAADYYEDNGTPDATDDYNIEGLRQRLTDHFTRTKELTLELYVQKIDVDDKGVIGVAYRYNTRALVSFPAGDKWLTATEVNKIKLRQIEDEEEPGFRILSGL